MKLEDLILVSVDDHAIEPPNAFARHMPAKYKGREPQVVQKNGRDVWVFEERATGYMGLNSVVGRPKEEYGMEPLGYEHMRRGTFDIKARVDDMNANGVLAVAAPVCDASDNIAFTVSAVMIRGQRNEAEVEVIGEALRDLGHKLEAVLF